MVELIDCAVEVGNGRGGQHAHCNTVNSMVDEVSGSHLVVLHHDLQCCLNRLAIVLVPNVGKEG